MVPAERIELPTFGLQNRCTTAVLRRHLRCCESLYSARLEHSSIVWPYDGPDDRAFIRWPTFPLRPIRFFQSPQIWNCHLMARIVDENSMDCPGFPILCFFLGVTCLHERHTHDAAVSEQSDLSAAACFGRATAKPSNRSMPWRASISVEWDE